MLAREVAAIPNSKGPANLKWENGSPLSPSQSDVLRRAFVAEISAAGISVADSASATLLRVSVQETPVRLLLIAEAQSGDAEVIRIVEVSRSSLSAHDGEGSAVSLQKELLWHQREPLLDAVEHMGSATKQPFLLLLNRNALAIYRAEKNAWVLQNSLPIPPGHLLGRDSRGIIAFPVESEDSFRITLEGRTCAGNLNDMSPLTCSPGWRVMGEEYMVADLCGSRKWSLSADEDDWSKPDRLSLRDASLDAHVPPAAELEMPGPALAISGGGLAHAVIFNLLTGEYEAYRIKVACGN